MRRKMRFLALLAMLSLSLVLAISGLAGAHGAVEAEGMKFTFGGTDEPVITGMRTWLELKVADGVSGDAVQGLEENLTLTVSYGEHAKTLEMGAVRGTPGAYKAAIWFTEAGTYDFVFDGKKDDGTAFQVKFHKDVADHRELFFPPVMTDAQPAAPAPEAPAPHAPAPEAAEPAAPAADITLTIGSDEATVGGRHMSLDSPAMIAHGRTMVPLRFIAEALGIEVHWDGATQTVHVGSWDNHQLGEPEEQAGHGHGGAAMPADPGMQPAQTFALNMFINGFVGVGGEYEGVRNPELKVRLGEPVRIQVINGDPLEHDFVIDELGVHTEHVFAEGERDSATFMPQKVGTFYYYCSVPGHRRAGMEGTITVTE